MNRFGGRDDRDIRETSKDKQVVVATHDNVGVCGKGQREDMVIGRITADRVFQGQKVDEFREMSSLPRRSLALWHWHRLDAGRAHAISN